MTKTDPQVYLAEAREKRVEAGNLIAQAEAFEQQARDEGLKVPSDDEDGHEQPADNDEKKSRFSRK